MREGRGLGAHTLAQRACEMFHRQRAIGQLGFAARGERLPVAVLGDGDFLMSATAFWTAAHYGIPLIAVVANNRSFFNDEVHQERVARQRSRPVENKWIGQRIGEPDIDIAAIARAQGLEGIGPVHTVGELAQALRRAVELARAGKAVVIDARVAAGYDPSTAAKLVAAGQG